MKIEFELEFEDWALFVIHVSRTDPASIRLGRMFRYGFGGAYIAFGIYALITGMYFAGVAMILLAFAWLILYPRVTVARVVKQLRKKLSAGEAEHLLGNYVMEADEEGLTASANGAHSSIPWELFTQTFEVEERAMLHLSPVKAVIIPLRADGAREFVDECHGYINN
ncbi:MAG: hypothetical protein GY747_04240 [Planctomycetes bacterium]|nr:hypothetical protein [Planctomycetota bacterium]MCP4770482.1 hypothetical protein [Planctomycetota bacterium]MCP4859922.1 hypothetical protein [Planctomycetota bacterium]